MRINKVVFENVRGLEAMDLALGADLTLVLAMNGIGKTTVIEGILLALDGLRLAALEERTRGLGDLVAETDHRRVWRANDLEVKKTLSIRVHAAWDEVPFVWEIRSTRSEIKTPPTTDGRVEWSEGKEAFSKAFKEAMAGKEKPLPLFAVLKAQRSPREKKAPLPTPSAEHSAGLERSRLWGKGVVVATAWNALRDRWFEEDRRRLHEGERAKNACETIAGALKRAFGSSVAPVFNGDESDFLLDLPGEGVRPVGMMSDGYRSQVATLVALAIRCAEINPGHADAGAVTPGVLLVDEVEQHLHPALQLRALDQIHRAFPKLQVIATTHSPLVIAGLPTGGSTEIVHLDRNVDGSMRLARLSAPRGIDAADVLTGAWFGLASTLDRDTLALMRAHRECLRKGESAREERRSLEAQLRERLGRFADSSVEELVLSVVAELEGDPAFEKKSHEEIKALRAKVLEAIKRGYA